MVQQYNMSLLFVDEECTDREGRVYACTFGAFFRPAEM